MPDIGITKFNQLRLWLAKKLEKLADHEREREHQLLLYGNCFEVDGKIVDCMDIMVITDSDGDTVSYKHKDKTYTVAEVTHVIDSRGIAEIYADMAAEMDRIDKETPNPENT